MKIYIKQTKANFKNEFEIVFDNDSLYIAKTSWLSRMFECTLSDHTKNLLMRTVYDTEVNLKNAIPFKWVTGSPKISRSCKVIAADGTEGLFAFATVGFFKSYYVIMYKDMTLNGYVVSKGDANYVALYDAVKDIQIGLLVKPLDVDNNLDTYTLYLLDNTNCDPIVLSFFAVYYDNWNYGNNREFVLGKREVSREWTFSKYNKKYDPEWVTKHFRVFRWSDPPDNRNNN